MAKKKKAAAAGGTFNPLTGQGILSAGQLAQIAGYNPAAGLVPTGQGGYTAPQAAPAPPPPQPAPPPPTPPPAAAPAPAAPAAPPVPQAASFGQPIPAANQPNNNVSAPGSGLGQAGGIFNNVTSPYDSQQGLTGVQEQGINTMNAGQGLVQAGAGTLQSAIPQIGTAASTLAGENPQIQAAANTMNQGVNTIGQAAGLQGQAVSSANAANPTVGGLANVGANQLDSILQGTNLSPSTNPYLAQTAQAANQQLINQYQEATAPGLAAEATAAYGGPGATQGSAFQQAQNYNEQALGQSLGETDASIYGTNYANAQNQITQGLGLVGQTQQSQYAPANQLLTEAGQYLNTGAGQVGAGANQLGVAGATNALGNSQLGVAGETLGVGQGQIGAGQVGVNTGATEFGAGTTQFGQQNQSIDQLLGIGAQQQAQAQQGLTTGQQNATAANQYPMNMLSQFGSLLGQATGGTGSQFSVGNTSK